MSKNNASMPTIGRILENLNKWRIGEKDGEKIGRGEQNEIGWEHFLHGRIVKEMRSVLPRAGSAASNNPVKAKELCASLRALHSPMRRPCGAQDATSQQVPET